MNIHFKNRTLDNEVTKPYHSSSGVWGAGTEDELLLSSSSSSLSISFCAAASLFLSIIFWVKSTRNSPSVSSSDTLEDKLNTIHRLFAFNTRRQEGIIDLLPTWKVSFCHLLIEFSFLLQPASVTREKGRFRGFNHHCVLTLGLLCNVLLNSPCCIDALLLLRQLFCIFLRSCWNTSVLLAPHIRFLNRHMKTPRPDYKPTSVIELHKQAKQTCP